MRARVQPERVLAVRPEDAVAHLHYGDLHRLQSQRVSSATERAELSRKALARYERAAALDPSYADPFRQLGLLHYQHGQNERAREAFERYLALAPDAPDGLRVREYLAALGP
jgi:regulator of sirC expression with transglutaminase-like and TPR domain